MANRESAYIEITPEVLLKAYACGIFPMAESAEDPSLYWIEPDLRGIIPLDRFYVSSRLARTVRSDQFKVTVNRDFDGVIDGCAEPQAGTAAHLDQRAHPHALSQAARAPALPQPRGLSRRRAGGRALRRRARPRLLRREHVPPRARCVEGRAGASGRAPAGRRLHAARHPVRHRSPQDRSARSKCRAGNITSCWKRRCSAKAISPRSTSAAATARRCWRSSVAPSTAGRPYSCQEAARMASTAVAAPRTPRTLSWSARYASALI